jgi:23S rRNA (uracil1939-C5)-methyltransferase
VFAGIQQTALGFLNARSIPAYDELTNSGLLRHLLIRRGERSGEIIVCFVINGEKIAGEEELAALLISEFPEIRGVLINTHTSRGNANLSDCWRVLYGRGYIQDSLCGLDLRVSAGAFYQVNSLAAEKLYEAALEMADLEQGETVLDLFCGAGAIGLFFAKQRPDISVTGVEIEERAVDDARENAKRNGIGNTRFAQADLGSPEQAAECLAGGFSTVVVDPPRKGLDPSVAAAIASAGPRRIVYISCDPATLSRDIRFLSQYGYVASKVRAVDLFPRTRHVEIIAVLNK